MAGRLGDKTLSGDLCAVPGGSISGFAVYNPPEESI
jgi:hypothetical protein